MANIAIYKHHPYCSEDSVEGINIALRDFHNITYFTETDINPKWLKQFDMVVFPGGIGDADSFDWLLADKAHMISHYVMNGGKYLGICMGAYWVGSHYFDLVSGVEPVQYIKQPGAQKRRSYGTVVNCEWEGEGEVMYFYDGCTFVSTGKKFDADVIASYWDAGDVKRPAAIIQGNVGAIGVHPESQEYWYDTWSYMPSSYHDGGHHTLLKEFVDKLLG